MVHPDQPKSGSCAICGKPIVLEDVARAVGLDVVTQSILCARCAETVGDDLEPNEDEKPSQAN